MEFITVAEHISRGDTPEASYRKEKCHTSLIKDDYVTHCADVLRFVSQLKRYCVTNGICSLEKYGVRESGVTFSNSWLESERENSPSSMNNSFLNKSKCLLMWRSSMKYATIAELTSDILENRKKRIILRQLSNS